MNDSCQSTEGGKDGGGGSTQRSTCVGRKRIDEWMEGWREGKAVKHTTMYSIYFFIRFKNLPLGLGTEKPVPISLLRAMMTRAAVT